MPDIRSMSHAAFNRRLWIRGVILTVAVMLGILIWWVLFEKEGVPVAKEKPIDLTPSYNGRTTESTTVRDSNSNPNTLEELPLGENVFAGVRFSVSGLVQLNGRYPDRIEGIALRKKCRTLHLLHGTVAKMPDGTTIAKVVLRYVGGAQAELEIRYGDHVIDWWQREADPPPGPHLKIAWNGQNSLTRREGASLNIYLNSFPNPRPDEEIASVDFVSANTRCWPFFLGLTVE